MAYGGQDETGTWSAFRRKGGADTTSPETPELPKEASGESKETLPWSQKNEFKRRLGKHHDLPFVLLG